MKTRALLAAALALSAASVFIDFASMFWSRVSDALFMAGCYLAVTAVLRRKDAEIKRLKEGS